jgi:Tol biopolymer transport system component
MRILWIIAVLLVTGLFIPAGFSRDEFPVLAGPYLGQAPPGMAPEVFAPGVVCTKEEYELNSVFSPAGDEFYYEISTTTPAEKEEGKYHYIIMFSRQEKGIWTKPQVAPFSGDYSTMDMIFSPDGRRLYFCSDRPDPRGSRGKVHIWYVERAGAGWSEPRLLGPPVYSPDGESQPTMARDGSLVFRRGDDLFFADMADGEYAEPVRLGAAVNSPYCEGKPHIAPDGDYLLFIRYDMPAHMDGGRGMYISFRTADGQWTPAKNTGVYGSLPKVTPDGRYLFFSRGGEIYWMDAGIIEDLGRDVEQ